jgi:citrate synthase
MDTWRTKIVASDEENIWIHGHDIRFLMRQAGFVETIFLLHRGRLPNAGESKLLDAILVASADHGAGAPSCATARLAASGNRQSVSAAVAAGILAIGDEHGGAGFGCMKMIAAGLQLIRDQHFSMEQAAVYLAEDAKSNRTHLPGFGHRKHTKDPRVEVLFAMAEEYKVAGDGIIFMRTLEAAIRTTIKPIPMNVDGALAAVLYDLGFPAMAGILFFIVGRVAGLTAEVAEEYAREKPMRIRIPVQYDGEPPRPME